MPNVLIMRAVARHQHQIVFDGGRGNEKVMGPMGDLTAAAGSGGRVIGSASRGQIMLDRVRMCQGDMRAAVLADPAHELVVVD